MTAHFCICTQIRYCCFLYSDAGGARTIRVPCFDRKELRGKLALAITANFKNSNTREEAAVDEISGVAFIFNQKFFKVPIIHVYIQYIQHVCNGNSLCACAVQ